VVLLGVAGGIYVWKPFFEDQVEKRANKLKQEAEQKKALRSVEQGS